MNIVVSGERNIKQLHAVHALMRELCEAEAFECYGSLEPEMQGLEYECHTNDELPSLTTLESERPKDKVLGCVYHETIIGDAFVVRVWLDPDKLEATIAEYMLRLSKHAVQQGIAIAKRNGHGTLVQQWVEEMKA